MSRARTMRSAEEGETTIKRRTEPRGRLPRHRDQGPAGVRACGYAPFFREEKKRSLPIVKTQTHGPRPSWPGPHAAPSDLTPARLITSTSAPPCRPSHCFPPPPSPPLASRRSPAVFSAPSCPATCTTTLLALPNDPTPTCDYRTTRLPVSCPTVSMQPPLFLAPQLNAPQTRPHPSSSCTGPRPSLFS